jgi:hypothetical protein
MTAVVIIPASFGSFSTCDEWAAKRDTPETHCGCTSALDRVEMVDELPDSVLN